MPFGSSNAPSTFIRLMTHVFQPFLGQFLVAYFGDILVYSKPREQCIEHLRQLFRILTQAKPFANLKLFVNLKKCVLHPWPLQNGLNPRDSLCTLTLLCLPLHPEERVIQQTCKITSAFRGINDRMSSNIVLRYPNFSKVFEVACDASRYGIGGVQRQKGQSTTFFCEEVSDSRQINYTTYRKNYMPYLSPFAIGGITVYLMNQLCVRTIKPLST